MALCCGVGHCHFVEAGAFDPVAVVLGVNIAVVGQADLAPFELIQLVFYIVVLPKAVRVF